MYTRGSPSPCLLGVRNYLHNYYAMYARLTRSRTRIEFFCKNYRDFRGKNTNPYNFYNNFAGKFT